ncbi:MAG: ParB/RepB/Spo0J family partition protein [Angelakisella sp.]|nr:ParB/RepB/Spo0J family partition protein [Angelakisella sp.]
MMLQRKPEVLNKVVLLPVSEILPSPHQPRRTFDEQELDILVKSISQNGLLVPISVRRAEKGYVLIAGERRLMACRKLGLKYIPSMIEEMCDTDAAILTLVENLHREGLSYFEEAQGIKALMEQENISQAKVCNILSMAQSTVANKLRILRLTEPVKEMLLQFGLGERVARALLVLEDEKTQLKACRHIGEHKLSAHAAEEYIKGLTAKPRPKQRRFVGHLKDYRIIFSTVDKAVEEVRRSGITVTTQKSEEDEYICYTIRIPKGGSRPAVSPSKQTAEVLALRTG